MYIRSNFHVKFNEIEKIISRNLDKRGLDKVNLTGQLESCVKSLNLSQTVVIVTGFVIKSAGVGETDGPPGALALAYGLERLGKKVVIVTDKYSEKFLKIGAELLNLEASIHIFKENMEDRQAELIINKYEPDHIIAIERPGRNIENRCYSMIGEDITEFCPNTDLLFIKAKQHNIKTSAVGDGGNEVGMGKVSDVVKKHVYKGSIICAQVETDSLIVAGVSNWGAFAICTGLCITNNKIIMYGEETYKDVLEKIVKAGAVDGCSKKNEATVDGLSYEENLSIFIKLKTTAENSVKYRLSASY
ncbi:DUF4392 domain-containing protein [Sedimentibacter saalensis]|uniref:DUF4392 domain-containing protein n=1 Tax=Sedimentibacter saalensis TaxID=130788 RepID=UPI0028A17C11|nr:DUF4392 domain-containing protein [Sedimentibacter saalensis]